MLFNVLNLFARNKTQPKVQVIRRDVTQFTLDEWRSSTALLNMAREVLANRDLKMMIDVLRNMDPSHMEVGVDQPLEVVATVQRRSEGYHQCLNNLYLMAVPLPQMKEIEPTFEAPEMPEIETENA